MVDGFLIHVKVNLDHLDLALCKNLYISQFRHCDFSCLDLSISQRMKLPANTSSISPAPASRANKIMCAPTSLKNFKYSIIMFPPFQHPVQVGLVDVGTAHPAPEEYGAVPEVVNQISDVVIVLVTTTVRKARALFGRCQFVPDQHLAALEQAQVVDCPDGNLACKKLHSLLVTQAVRFCFDHFFFLPEWLSVQAE
jgi:hypothetical protein